jgi:PAS domain S-box-containing protein
MYRGWGKRIRLNGRDKLALSIMGLLWLVTIASYPADISQSVFPGMHSDATVILASSFLNIVFTLLGALVIICAVIVTFSLRLKRVNSELKQRNDQILEINNDLKRMNSELEVQKELIAKEYYESDKFYKVVVQSADDGISFFDRDWNLKFSNRAFYDLIGYDKDEYIALDPHSLIHPDDQDYQARRVQTLFSTGFFESELRLKHKDGHFVNLSTRSVTVRDDNGEVLGSLTISRDITKLKQVHEDLIKANIESEASSRLKSSFLANISHEIRTPLNSVVGFANLLLADNLTQDVREDYIEHINYNSEKLLQIIGDIIDLSRLESSQIEISYEETSLSEIVSEIIEEAKQVIKRNEKPITLNLNNKFANSGDLIFTDRIWLKRVLNHLMDNAVKFTLDGSIEFSYMKDGDKILFKIKDTGIGINKENLGRIFEEFRQEVDGHHRPFEGLGIGLTLAKEVVERMGGRIYVQSEKGIGSEFSFSIPYRPAGTPKNRVTPVITESVRKPIDWSFKKCLLVDDNKDVLIYLNGILIDTGVSVIMARSGFEAIELIKAIPDINVVLLDMQMPEMNGIEATREIRKIRKNLPIIAQTAFIFEDDKDIILEAGCDACLIKPIRKEHLLEVMSGFVNSDQSL